MGIRFIFGRAGTGKTTFCLNQVKSRLEKKGNTKLVLIVPEQYTFDTEKKFLDIVTEKGLLRGEVISFKRMADVVFETCGGRTDIRMNDSGKNMLIYKILKDNLNNLEYFNRVAKQQGFSMVISKIITEFKKYNISLEMLETREEEIEDVELRKKMRDLSFIYKEFNKEIENKFIDVDDDLTTLATKLKECNIYKGSEIWIDEFTTFTPQQLEIIKQLAKTAKTVNITLCSDSLGEYVDRDFTDVFDAIKNTEQSILRIMKENNIGYMEPINLNKGFSYRFRNSEDIQHLEKYFFTYPFKRYLGDSKNIRIYKANNSYDELEVISKDILNKVRDEGYRFKDIAVVCRNIEDYEKITSVIFNEYNIPFFMDKKREILNNPLVILIISALEIITNNWSYEGVFKYLKSGLIKIEKEYIDELENYILANGIKGYKWTRNLYESVEKEEERSEDELRIIEIMEEIRNPIMDFNEKIKGKHLVKEIATRLYEFLIELRIFDTLDTWLEEFKEIGLQDKVKEYEQVPKMVMDILDQIVEVLGNEKIEIKEFTKILISGFEEKEIGVIPMALDQVNVGDISRVKGREVKVLYVIGVNDGVLPLANKEEGIISDKERNYLKEIGVRLAADTKTRAFEEQFIVYTALTIPSDKLIITYPMADFEGKALRPSIIIPRLKKIMPKVIEESELCNIQNKEDKFNKITTPIPTFNEMIVALRLQFEKKKVDDYWAEVYKWFENDEEYKNKSKIMFRGLTYTNLVERVPKEKMKKLYETNNKLMFSVSRLEKYAQCPFSYYVQYGLKAKDRKVYEFTAPDLGTFMHDILDGFTSQVKAENLAWSELDKERCKVIVGELVDKKLEGDFNSILNSTNKYRYFADRFKRTITKSVTVLSEQMRKGQFEVFKNEFAFGSYKDGGEIKLQLPSKEIVYLQGRVDRIDTLDLDGNTYIKVIDYKSGAKKFDLKDVYYGIQIQLLVYLDALLKNSKYILEKQSLPGAILYFRIDDPIIKSNRELLEEEIKNSILKELRMSGLILKDVEVVRALDGDVNTTSLIIPAGIKRDGEFSSNSSVATEEQFEVLRKYVNLKMISICEEMLSGEIKIEPAKKDKTAFCTYCDYSSICQFDTGIENNKYKLILKKDKEEVWNLINEEVKEGGDL
ncbi:helicase-exonuclease AddAB subunit AddB [Clostridium sp.]|uniref:helicase-exonuclease AddAB subunit AddB n=1 Tax=Clostridium sp. TaxID=1506 RepID=UPI0026223D3A|nr:helicase-exonuclease AddAB subunit AddB [Clostridium sp.]